MAEGEGLNFMKNEPKIEKLRKLTKYDCLVVTEDHLMRGIDYRSKDGSGIDLLVGRDFPHQRAYE